MTENEAPSGDRDRQWWRSFIRNPHNHAANAVKEAVLLVLLLPALPFLPTDRWAIAFVAATVGQVILTEAMPVLLERLGYPQLRRRLKDLEKKPFAIPVVWQRWNGPRA
jgi:hypothetical protein